MGILDSSYFMLLTMNHTAVDFFDDNHAADFRVRAGAKAYRSGEIEPQSLLLL